MTEEHAAFGARLGAGRRSAGLSQEQLADRSGLSVRAISNLERGRTRSPHPDSVARLADALALRGEERRAFIASAGRRLGGAAGSAGDPVVPRQLPAPVRHFTGREAELATMSAVLAECAGTPVVFVVHGMAGVGKTTLAVHWASRMADEFPDGQLYVNLRGFDPSGKIMLPADAMRRLLDALGVPTHRIPADLDAQAALYRTLLTHRRVLVVLDNAGDADQVRPLLPGGPGCAVVVTSRSRLTPLVASGNVQPVALGPLTADEARQLLRYRLGARCVDDEPDAVRTIIDRCGRLPLALAVVAARAAGRTEHPLSCLADEVTGVGLEVLSAGDAATDVRTVFSWSYRALSEDGARLFRCLGLHPGPDLSLAAATSLAGLPVGRTRAVLDELTRAHLLVEHVPGRYAFHDLLRAYASELAGTHDSAEARDAVTRRMLDHYLHTASAANTLLAPAVEALRIPAAADGVRPERLADQQEARTWFAAEHAVLLGTVDHAAATGFDRHAWYLAAAQWTFLYREVHWRDWAATGRTALAAARRLGDLKKQARAYRAIGRAYAQLGRLSEAHTELHHALDLYCRAGSQVGQGHTYYNLAFLSAEQGRTTEAVTHANQAFDLYHSAGHRYGQAQALSMIGEMYNRLGDHARALTFCQQALAIGETLDDMMGVAGTLGCLADAHLGLGQGAEALSCYEHALDLTRRVGARYYEAETLACLGNVHETIGQNDQARTVWMQSLRIFEALDHPDAQTVRARLARLDGVR